MQFDDTREFEVRNQQKQGDELQEQGRNQSKGEKLEDDLNHSMPFPVRCSLCL
jgi:hypothetical protein